MKKTGLLILISAVLLAFSGCGNSNGVIADGKAGGKNIERFADDAQIVAFKWNHSGSALEPYYIVKSEENGSRWLISIDGENPENAERVSNVLSDSSDLKAFSDALLAAGILKWDGFSMSRSLGKSVLDGDDGFSLEITFSDGNTLVANGYNAFPDNYSGITAIIRDTFKAHEDYSRYYPTVIPDDTAVDDLVIRIGSPFAPPNASGEQFKIELNESRKQWIVTLSDPKGRFLDKGTYISEYAEDTESLPFDKYTELLDRYGFFALNGQTEDFSSEKGDQYININGYFADGRCIEIRKTVNEDDYKAFITEFIEMTHKYVLDRQ